MECSMKSIKDVIKEYPYAAISTFMGMIALCIVGLIYIGAFDAFVPIKNQGAGFFNFNMVKGTNPQKTIVDYLNMASIMLSIIGLIVALFSRLKQEEKLAYNTAAIACILPLFLHFLLVGLIIILIVAFLNSPFSFFCD
jgi:hypothetical protein